MPLRLLICALFVLLGTLVAPAQTPAPKVKDTNSPVGPVGPVLPGTIPLAEVVAKAETDAVELRTLQGEATSEALTTLRQRLDKLTAATAAALEDNGKSLTFNVSLDTLRRLEGQWHALRLEADSFNVELTNQAGIYDQKISSVREMAAMWAVSQATVKAAHPPPEVQDRINATIALIDPTQKALEKRRAAILGLQSDWVERDARITKGLAAVQTARREAVDRLFVKDSPPLWGASAVTYGPEIQPVGMEPLADQFEALQEYAAKNAFPLFLQGAFFLLVAGTLYRIRRRLGDEKWSHPDFAPARQALDYPIATASLVVLLICSRANPGAPSLWHTLIGAAALLPAVVLLRCAIRPGFYPVVNILVALYLADHVRTIAGPWPLVARWIYIGEYLAAMLGLAWLIWARPAAAPGLPPVLGSAAPRGATRLDLIACLWAFGLALAADIFGYVSFANLLGGALLGSAYLALILFAAVKISDGLLLVAFDSRPLNLLGSVRTHAPLLRRRLHRAIAWLALAIWVLTFLDLLSVRHGVLAYLGDILDATYKQGEFTISLSGVLYFAGAVWGSFLLSRFIRFLLDEEVYPRVQLSRGLPYAISTTLHYAVLVVGFMIALALMGVSLTNFTILASAFGVGLAFGLQNIINNFVSGLILLFERPLKIGDMVQIDGNTGVVNSIGIRATIVRTSAGSQIIVPNGKLISDNVTNWTLSNRKRIVQISFAVAEGTSPQVVMDLLREVAEAHPLVAKSPPPQPLMTGYGAKTLLFELTAWTEEFEQSARVRSDLGIAIEGGLRREKIALG